MLQVDPRPRPARRSSPSPPPTSTELEFAQNIERLAAPVSARRRRGRRDRRRRQLLRASRSSRTARSPRRSRRVTEEGVTYLTAAGNDNLFNEAGRTKSPPGKRRIRSTTELPGQVARLSDDCPKKAGRTNRNAWTSPRARRRHRLRDHGRSAEAKLVVDLQWAEPWFGVKSTLRLPPERQRGGARRNRRNSERRQRSRAAAADRTRSAGRKQASQQEVQPGDRPLRPAPATRPRARRRTADQVRALRERRRGLRHRVSEIGNAKAPGSPSARRSTATPARPRRSPSRAVNYGRIERRRRKRRSPTPRAARSPTTSARSSRGDDPGRQTRDAGSARQARHHRHRLRLDHLLRRIRRRRRLATSAAPRRRPSTPPRSRR